MDTTLATNYLQLKNNQKIGSYTATENVLEGKKQLIVPVTMIVEGVLNGSAGPLLHLAEEFGKIPESWNGIPIVIYHPEQDGHGISANSPDVIDQGKIGMVFYSHMEDNKLRAQAWLDEEKLGIVSNETLLAVQAGKEMELSVGVYTENETISGVWNGIKYDAIARNHRPDHLALLPDGVGACSIEDGCGIRNNQKKGEKDVDRLEALKVIRESNYSVIEIGVNMDQGLKQKLDELYDLVRSLRVQPDAQGNGGSWTYLEEAYDTYLIYSVEDGKGYKYYKCNYQFSVTDGKAGFVGNPIEVVRKVEFESVINNEGLNLNKEKETKSMVEKCTPCVEKKVGEIIANKATKFTEVDREWLQTLELAVLEKMEPEVITIELNAADKAALEVGKKTLADERAAMIATIQDNTEAGIWTPEILDNMDRSMLEKISKSVAKKVVEKTTEEVVDYSLNGNGGGFQTNSKVNEVEPMYPIV